MALRVFAIGVCLGSIGCITLERIHDDETTTTESFQPRLRRPFRGSTGYEPPERLPPVDSEIHGDGHGDDFELHHAPPSNN